MARPTARRTALLDELNREARRTGSVGALHSRAIADAAGLHSTDYECIDVLDWTGPVTAGELARYPAFRWIGVLPLLTGVFRYCPAYRFIGFNTCPLKK